MKTLREVLIPAMILIASITLYGFTMTAI